jgi:transcriptional regulator with XRE-family HTH domain
MDAPTDERHNDAALGTALRRLRDRSGLSLVMVAQRAGVSVPALHQYERGTAKLPVTTLFALLAAMGHSGEDFLLELEGTSPTSAARRAARWLQRFADAVEGRGA